MAALLDRLNPTRYRNDQLTPWLLLSLCIHLVILFLLGVWGLTQQIKKDPLAELEIILTPPPSSRSPAHNTHILSQHTQQGENRLIPPKTPAPAANPGQDARQQLAQETIQILPSALPKHRRGQFTDGAHQGLTAQQPQALLRQYNPLREKVINSATREHRFAAYMDAWRRRVENVGSRHLHNANTRQITGRLILDVAVTANGEVHAIDIQKSSGNRALDQTALDIVRMAAPFKPLPANIRSDTDILHIVRTWNFNGRQIQ